MAWKSFRDESRTNWGREDCGSADQAFTRDDIKYGATLRIADALERLAIGKTELETQAELDKTKAELRYARSLMFAYKKSVAAHKGIITKLKKAKEA